MCIPGFIPTPTSIPPPLPQRTPSTFLISCNPNRQGQLLPPSHCCRLRQLRQVKSHAQDPTLNKVSKPGSNLGLHSPTSFSSQYSMPLPQWLYFWGLPFSNSIAPDLKNIAFTCFGLWHPRTSLLSCRTWVIYTPNERYAAVFHNQCPPSIPKTYKEMTLES